MFQKFSPITSQSLLEHLGVFPPFRMIRFRCGYKRNSDAVKKALWTSATNAVSYLAIKSEGEGFEMVVNVEHRVLWVAD